MINITDMDVIVTSSVVIIIMNGRIGLKNALLNAILKALLIKDPLFVRLEIP